MPINAKIIIKDPEKRKKKNTGSLSDIREAALKHTNRQIDKEVEHQNKINKVKTSKYLEDLTNN